MRHHLLARLPRPAPATVIATAALVFAAGGFAVATIPTADGTIHGCYATNGGQLRIVQHTKCKKREKAISWNKDGPASVKVRSTTVTLRYKCNLISGTYWCGAPERNVTVHCRSGERATGGGYGQGSNGAMVSDTYPSPTTGTPTGWTARVSGFTTGSSAPSPDGTVPIYAVCIA
jgi:hypothetical protein